MNYSKEKRELLLFWQIYETLMSLARKLDRQKSIYTNELTARQYMTILAIQLSQKGGATIGGITKKLGTTKQNVTQLIHMLEKKGYAKRTIPREDKRGSEIHATDAGINAMLEYAETEAMVMTDVFISLTEEEGELLCHLLKKLYQFDGTAYAGIEDEAYKLLENEHSDVFRKMLEEYRKRGRELC